MRSDSRCDTTSACAKSTSARNPSRTCRSRSGRTPFASGWPISRRWPSATDRGRASPAPHELVALVSHAGTINAYFAELLGTRRDFFFPTGNTSLSTVRIEDGRSLLVRLNDTAHLERRGRSAADAAAAERALTRTD
jgi:hypothetical protein